MKINKKILSAIQATVDIHRWKWWITLRLKDGANFNIWPYGLTRLLEHLRENYSKLSESLK
jgi:hypothetical protein